MAILEEKNRGLRMKNKLRKSLELVGINLARNSHSLGLTPYLTFYGIRRLATTFGNLVSRMPKVGHCEVLPRP